MNIYFDMILFSLLFLYIMNLYDCMVLSRFLCRDADQVALNRVSNSALHRALFPALHAHKRRDQSHIPAAVPVAHAMNESMNSRLQALDDLFKRCA